MYRIIVINVLYNIIVHQVGHLPRDVGNVVQDDLCVWGGGDKQQRWYDSPYCWTGDTWLGRRDNSASKNLLKIKVVKL